MFTTVLWKENLRRPIQQEKLFTVLTKLLEGSTDISELHGRDECKMDCRTLHRGEIIQALDFIDKELPGVFIVCARREILPSDDSDDEDTPYIGIDDNEISKITPKFIYLSITKVMFKSKINTCFPNGEPESLDLNLSTSNKHKASKTVSFN